jgi:hypothetical protein
MRVGQQPHDPRQAHDPQQRCVLAQPRGEGGGYHHEVEHVPARLEEVLRARSEAHETDRQLHQNTPRKTSFSVSSSPPASREIES